MFALPFVFLSTVAVLNAGVAFFVYWRRPHDMVGSSFTGLVTMLAYWALAIFGFLYVADKTIAIYFMKGSYVAALLMAVAFYNFALSFHAEKPPSILHRRIILLITLVTCGLIAIPDFLTSGIVYHEWGKQVILNPVHYTLFAALFLYLFVGGHLLLWSKWVQARGQAREQLLLVTAGGTISGLIGIYFNLILPSPFLNDFRYIWTGPVFTFLYAVDILYSIFRYKLFNAKMAITELLVFSLWIFVFMRILIAASPSELAAESILFVATIIIGILLIISANHEIKQREDIERFSEQKSEFMTFASHEIRNPVTAMRGYASLLLDGTAGEVSPQVKDMAQKILISGDRVLSLISQFLDRSKLELGQITYTISDFDASDMLNGIADEFSWHATQRGIAFERHIDFPHLHAHADEPKLREALSNIIDNAIKYTKEGSVSVSIEKRNGKARISVADTGEGIDPAEMPNLFKKFSRADYGDMNMLGSGLGLYLAKTFIDGMGGSIAAHSAGTGRGTTFVIEVPAT